LATSLTAGVCGIVFGHKYSNLCRLLCLILLPLESFTFISVLGGLNWYASLISFTTLLFVVSFWLFARWIPGSIYFCAVYTFVLVLYALTIAPPLAWKDLFITIIPVFAVTYYAICLLLRAREKERILALSRLVRIESQMDERKMLFEEFPFALLSICNGSLRWHNQAAKSIFPQVSAYAAIENIFNPGFAEWIHEAEITPGTNTGEITIKKSNGRVKNLHVTATHMDWHDEKSLLLTIKDVTAEREMDRFRTRWISTVSHEFKTPLNTVLNLVSHLTTFNFDETTNHFLTLGYCATELLITYVGDLLDYYQLQSQKFDVICGTFDIREILNRCANILQVRAADKDITIYVDVDSRVPDSVKSDPKRLQQILINLLGNSLKFSPAHSSMRIQAVLHKFEDRDVIRVAVVDHGVGIKPENLRNLFQEFGRIKSDENEKLNPSGVGLGLWISNNLASRMGSRLSAFSRYGKGSTFMFDVLADGTLMEDPEFALKMEHRDRPEDPYDNPLYSPFEKRDTTASASSSSLIADEYEQTPEARGSKAPVMYSLDKEYGGGKKRKEVTFVTQDIKYDSDDDREKMKPVKKLVLGRSYTEAGHRDEIFDVGSSSSSSSNSDIEQEREDERKEILIVDDDYSNRFVISILCERAGLTVKLAPSGEEAIQKYTNSFNNRKQSRFKCVIMDYQMPKMSGPEAVRKIRDFEKKFSVQNICILGHTAFSSSEELDEFHQSGINGILGKPVTWENFQTTLRKYTKVLE